MDLSQPGVAGFVGVLVGGVLTAIISVGAELVRARRASSLDSAMRREERRLHREEIQRSNLLEVQVALGDWLRIEDQIALSDLRALHTAGRPRGRSDELTAMQLETARRFMSLTERVTDDQLRQALTELRSYGTPGMASTPAEAEAAGNRLAFASERVNVMLGEVLRQYL